MRAECSLAAIVSGKTSIFLYFFILFIFCFFFFFNDTATTEIYTLSLHDALPIFHKDNTVKGLLIGDLDVQDVQYVVKTAIAKKVDFVVLPSYGGIIGTHGAKYTTQLCKLIEEAAKELKIEGVTIFARSHPIAAEWADINLEIVAPELCVPKSTSNSI